ncbi:MAG: hypothetical protein PHQ45_02230 [Acidaminococcaceae bacterium]|nr:hypothetical protein [Acidaminococcaceae bacterium]
MKAKVYHVHGLPLPEGAECTIELVEHGVKISCGDYLEDLPFERIATFDFDGCDIVEEDGLVGLISGFAGGLVGRLEGKKFLSWVAPKTAKYPEDVTVLIVNFLDSDVSVKRSVFVEAPDTNGQDSVIDMVFAYNDVKPNHGEEYLKKYGPTLNPQRDKSKTNN